MLVLNQHKNYTRFLLKINRFLSTNHSHVDKYTKFRRQIDADLSISNKNDSLIYLNNLFSSFQSMVALKYIDNPRMNAFWSNNLNKIDVEQISKSLNYVNKHENFKALKLYLNENLNQYNLKEIALITNMYSLLEMDKNDSHSAKLIKNLDDYCVKNVKNFDLNDIDHITASCLSYLDKSAFVKASLDHLYDNLINRHIEVNDLDTVKPDIGEFENQMKLVDGNYYNVWLKLKLFKRYSGEFTPNALKYSIYKLFKHATKKLSTCDSMNYKVNLLIRLLNCANDTNKEIGVLMSSQSKYIQRIKNDFVPDLFKNLDLIEYKQEMRRAFKSTIFSNLLTATDIDNINEYFTLKLQSKSLTMIEYFQYLELLSYLLYFKSKTGQQKSKTYQVKNPIEIVLGVNRYEKHVKSNLDEKLKSSIIEKYDEFIKDVNLICLSSLRGSINMIFYNHHNIQYATNMLYEALFRFCGQEKYIGQVLQILPTLALVSDKFTKDNELKLSEIVAKTGLKIAEKDSIDPLAIKNSIMLLLMNQETVLSNYPLIIQKFNESIPFLTLHEISLIYLLFKNNFPALLSNDKANTIEFCKILFSKFINSLNSNEILNTRRTTIVSDLFSSITSELKKKYFNNEINLIEYNSVFTSNISSFKLNSLDDNQIKSITNEEHKNLPLSLRTDFTNHLLKQTRYYSIHNLNKIWSYLFKNLKINSNYDGNFAGNWVRSICHMMNLFTVFDYTTNDCVQYKNQIKEFEQLNREFYLKYHDFITRDNNNYMKYTSSLICLNCFVKETFEDFVYNFKNISFKNRNSIKLLLNQQFLMIKYPNERKKFTLDTDLSFVNPVNKKFFKDFKEFYKEFVSNDNAEQDLKSIMIALDDQKNVTRFNSPNAVHFLPILLIDNLRTYANKPLEYTRIYDMIIKQSIALNSPFIVINENEFYTSTDKNSLLNAKIDKLKNKINL